MSWSIDRIMEELCKDVMFDKIVLHDRVEYRLNGLLHNRSDEPAVIYNNGRKEWRECDELHRLNGPAIVHPDGTEEWYMFGYRHRDLDEPAITLPDGTKYWYHVGRQYRGGGKPNVILANGTQCWYEDGVLHRDYNQGPAIIFFNGRGKHYIHGKEVHSVRDSLIAEYEWNNGIAS